MSKNTVTLPSDKSVETAIGTLRSSSGDRFLVLGYSSGNELSVVAEGDGSDSNILTAAASHLPEDTERYIMLKKVVVEDEQAAKKVTTNKVLFLSYAPSGIKSLTRKGMLSQLRQQVATICKPYHGESNLDSKDELTDSLVIDKLGMKKAVTDQKATVKVHKEEKNPHQSFIPQPTSSSSTHSTNTPIRKSVSGGQPVQSKIPPQSVKFVEGDEEKFKSALKSVHENKEGWVVVSYSAKDTLSFVGGGVGFDSLRAALPEETQVPFYGVARVDLSDGKSHTQRFVYLNYTNEAIPPMKKADASTKSGAIMGSLGTTHAKLEISKPSDATDEAIKGAK